MRAMKTVSNRDIFRLFWVHILRYKWRALVVVLAIVVATAADLVVPWFLKAFIDTLATSAPSGLALRTLIGILLSLLGLHGIGWVAWRVCGFVNSDFQPRVMADLQRTGFDHLLGHSYAFFADNFAGSLTRRVVRVSRAFERIADEMSFRLIPIVLILIGTSIGLSLRSPALMGVFLVWTGVFLYTNYLASLWKLAIDVVRAAADSRITAALSDSITNSITVKIFNGVREETRRLADVLRSWRLLSTRAWNRGEVIFAIQGALMILLEFGMLVYGSILWRRGIFGVGDLVLIQSYLLVAFNKLWDFGRSFRNIFEALADAREMVEILALPHEVRDRRRPKTFAVRRGRIEFKEVSFAFHRTRVVLDRFSLAIRPGERVALVGPSGAGKSTVTRLLFRFHDLSAGRILIDGQDIAAVAQDDLRAGIALVPQEPILFHRTLMENIRYGRRDATDDEVIAAATEAR
ncbi:ABC transporter ATP-binding protein, partial [Patescibacteria group bacterium]